MAEQLRVSIGQHSEAGRKALNQDFHGAYVPDGSLLDAKGVAVALADGISSSEVSQIASEVAVTGFFEDYFCTADAWSVQKSAQRVLTATNSWLHAQTRRSPYRHDQDRGYVCTLSALILKATTAHIFHIGDTRVYRLQGGALEQLTNDHRLRVSRDTSYLSRALGINQQLEIDYRALTVEAGEVFFLASDGVYDFAEPGFIAHAIREHADDLDRAARVIVAEAYAQGSTDNLTAQIVRIDALPRQDAQAHYRQLTALPFPPVLEARQRFDGYTIVRGLHASSRSHVYLARDEENQALVVLKTPSIDLRHDGAYLERFLTEEWIARRINSAQVLKPCPPTRRRNYLYTVAEFIDGQTLSQWMIDHPKTDLETVRGIVEQIARGLRAFHRLEMLHQDLRPDNIMIDASGTVKIIDFGSTRVAGLMETGAPGERDPLLGTAQYTAPEYFLGAAGSTRSDLFSLAVISYQMLTGRLPYGTRVAAARSRTAQRKLRYRPIGDTERPVPGWIDEVLQRALHPDPGKRHEDLSEFVFELRHPNKAYLSKVRPPLMERDPVLFWKSVSLLLTLAVVALLLRS